MMDKFYSRYILELLIFLRVKNKTLIMSSLKHIFFFASLTLDVGIKLNLAEHELQTSKYKDSTRWTSHVNL